ncbi:MAG: DUF1289 domain-containing protein [Fibrobacteres bacterium]|nr:DUF1289 domain-containing protein [Fibrobacterota bacterium]
MNGKQSCCLDRAGTCMGCIRTYELRSHYEYAAAA